MPRATVTQETTRVDLRSCPGGYVELRTLSFHEMQMRQEMAARVYQETKTPKKGEKRQREETVRGYFEIMNVAVTEYEFRNCITDHNLEDENGHIIDFTRPMQSWRLDPKIGQEIGKRIDDLNQFDAEDEDELAPLEMQHSSPSLVGETTSQDSTANE
jgi:formylglycine-generating enzyme required for sulfatase activity